MLGYAFEEDSVEIGMDESGRPSGMAWITMKTPSEVLLDYCLFWQLGQSKIFIDSTWDRDMLRFLLIDKELIDLHFFFYYFHNFFI